MNTFEINGTALRDGWGGADRFWFSLKDYKVRDAAAMSGPNFSVGLFCFHRLYSVFHRQQ